MNKDVKGRFSSRKKLAQKKQVTMKKNDEILRDKDLLKSTYQTKVDELMTNNKALMQALRLSYKTIYHQNKVILNLEKKLISQVPEILKSKLQIIGNALKELCLIVEETTKLLDSNAVTSLIPEEEAKNLRSSFSIITADVAENYRKIFKKKKKSKKKTYKANLTSLESLINEYPEMLEELNTIEEEFPEPPCLSHYDIEEPQTLLAPNSCAEIIQKPELDEIHILPTIENMKKKKNYKSNKMPVINNLSPNTNNKSKKNVNLNFANKIKSKAKKQLNETTKKNAKSKASLSFQNNAIELKPQSSESLQNTLIHLEPQKSFSSNLKVKKSVKSSNISNLSTIDNHIPVSNNAKKLPATKKVSKFSKTNVKKPSNKKTLKVKCLPSKLKEAAKSNDTMSQPSRRARNAVNYSLIYSSDSDSEVHKRLPLKKIKQESDDKPLAPLVTKKYLIPPLIDLTIQPKVLLRDIFAESQIEINPLFKKAFEDFNQVNSNEVNTNNDINLNNNINSSNEENSNENLCNEANNKICSNINVLSENNELSHLSPIEVNPSENVPLFVDIIKDRIEKNMNSFQETFDGVNLATQAFIDSLDADNDTYILP